MQKGNQYLRGRSEAFAGFRDVLAREMVGCLAAGDDDGDDGGSVRAEVERVVGATGGVVGEGRNGEGGVG